MECPGRGGCRGLLDISWVRLVAGDYTAATPHPAIHSARSSQHYIKIRSKTLCVELPVRSWIKSPNLSSLQTCPVLGLTEVSQHVVLYSQYSICGQTTAAWSYSDCVCLSSVWSWGRECEKERLSPGRPSAGQALVGPAERINTNVQSRVKYTHRTRQVNWKEGSQ